MGNTEMMINTESSNSRYRHSRSPSRSFKNDSWSDKRKYSNHYKDNRENNSDRVDYKSRPSKYECMTIANSSNS